MISVVINADTRAGYLTSARGKEYGNTSLEGVRCVDFLTDGVKNKMKFFYGYDTQCVLYIDQHEPLSDMLFMEVNDLVKSYGNNSKLIIKSHDRVSHRWNDRLYIESLKLSEGDYIAHFDQDANAFKEDGSDIVEAYFDLLDGHYKYICQPTYLTFEQHGMFHASTRFFICKKETLDLPYISNNLVTPFMGKWTPCFEHIIGAIAGDGNVLYPLREDEKYIIFNWATYNSGTLKKLNEMSYTAVKKYIIDECGIHGANDVIDKIITNG